MFIIHSGIVEVIDEQEDGSEVVLTTLEQGGFVKVIVLFRFDS